LSLELNVDGELSVITECGSEFQVVGIDVTKTFVPRSRARPKHQHKTKTPNENHIIYTIGK